MTDFFPQRNSCRERGKRAIPTASMLSTRKYFSDKDTIRAKKARFYPRFGFRVQLRTTKTHKQTSKHNYFYLFQDTGFPAFLHKKFSFIATVNPGTFCCGHCNAPKVDDWRQLSVRYRQNVQPRVQRWRELGFPPQRTINTIVSVVQIKKSNNHSRHHQQCRKTVIWTILSSQPQIAANNASYLCRMSKND